MATDRVVRSDISGEVIGAGENVKVRVIFPDRIQVLDASAGEAEKLFGGKGKLQAKPGPRARTKVAAEAKAKTEESETTMDDLSSLVDFSLEPDFTEDDE